MRKISQSELNNASSRNQGGDLLSQIQHLVNLGPALERAAALADQLKKAGPRLVQLEKRYEALWKSIENLHSIVQRIEKVQADFEKYIERHDLVHNRLDGKMATFGNEYSALTRGAIGEFKQAANALQQAIAKDLNVSIPEIRIPEIRIPDIVVREDEKPKEIDFSINRDSRGLIRSVTAKEK